MLISVIIPVYNVEKYLVKCVESVLHQTYTNIEIILVNDGSSDKSPEICDYFAAKDNRVKVIHKPNGGPSESRNTGLNLASGDYITFMDADDFWSDMGCLSKLVDEVKKTPECDFVGFNCSYYYEDVNKVVPWVKYDDEILKTTTSDVCIEKLVASGTFPMSQCMKIIRRERLQGNIEFIKGIYCEDIPWFIELLKKSDKCRFVNLYMYMYRKNVATSRSSSYSYKQFSDLLMLLREGVELNKKECIGQTQAAIFSFWAYELCILRAMTGFMNQEQRKEELNKLYEYNWLLNYQLHPKVKKVAMAQKYLGKRLTNYILYKYLQTRLV